MSGGPEVNFVHQPSLEAEFRAVVRDQPTVELNLGWELAGFIDHGSHVEIRLQQLGGTEARTLRTRYLVGVDGANSTVRESLGIGREDIGFEADWLVVDMKLHPGITLDIPDCGQYCNPGRPTTMVPGGLQDGRVCRRWEFSCACPARRGKSCRTRRMSGSWTASCAAGPETNCWTATQQSASRM